MPTCGRTGLHLLFSMSWSDHSTVCIIIEDYQKSPSAYLWRMDTKILQTTPYASSLRDNLENLISLNKDSVDDPNTLWTAHKAIKRGLFIQFGSRDKKLRKQRLDSLLMKIQTIDTLNKMQPSAELKSKLIKLRLD